MDSLCGGVFVVDVSEAMPFSGVTFMLDQVSFLIRYAGLSHYNLRDILQWSVHLVLYSKSAVSGMHPFVLSVSVIA